MSKTKKTVFGMAAAAMLMASVSFGFGSKSFAKEEGVPKYRTATGTYYDYMCIETDDGREWLLSDKNPRRNPYMVRTTVNGKRVYKTRFQNGQRVTVKFDTRRTRRKSDDRVVSVKAKRNNR